METNNFFRRRLEMRQKKTTSLLCVGLDPKLENMPECLKKNISRLDDPLQVAVAVAAWMKKIVDATAQYACMFKPQKAHWEALGKYGQLALRMLTDYIREHYPDIPIFLDCKRGDIDATQEMYRTAQFEHDGADGMNFNPYMGKSCMKALIDKEHPERALVGLCYTSNPDARETQDVILADGRSYWEFIAVCTLNWANELSATDNAGLVMAAAYEHPKGSGVIYSEHLKRCRELVKNFLWFLIPGVGKQGGAIFETVMGAFAGWGSMAINSSSEIIFASMGDDFAEAAAAKAKEAYDAMIDALGSVPKDRY
jgi:orotidine-5'-phosphate decarboxylase